MPVSSRIEDYLEALFQLESAGKRLTVTALADKLALTKGTVATGVKKMEEAGLVSHAAYGDVFLTPKGREIGWKVLIKHDALTNFFCGILNIDPEKAEEIACLTVHYLEGKAASRFFNMIDFLYEARIAKEEWMNGLLNALDKPQTLPRPMTLWNEKSGKICRLSGSADLCDRLEELGIKTGDLLKNIRFDEDKNEFSFKANEQNVTLAFADAATVWLC